MLFAVLVAPCCFRQLRTKFNVNETSVLGDTKLQPLAKHLPRKIVCFLSRGLLHRSMRSMSSTDDVQVEDIQLKPLNTNIAIVLSKRTEMADTQQGGAMDGEESRCSDENVAENAKQGSAEDPSSCATLHKDANGAGCSESNKAIVNICQESEKEQNVKLAKIDVKANETAPTTHS